MTPIVAVIVGVALLGEPITWNEPVGGAIVLAGTAISQGRHLRDSLEVVE
jgi:drug/metabolite transporter (DMT)-like permease